MKNLKDILVEKLDINKVKLNDEFPIDGTVEDIVKFLKNEDFKEIHGKGAIDELFNSAKSKCFYKNENQLWFTDTSKERIFKGNPIFTYRILSNGLGVYYFDADGRICWLMWVRNKNSAEVRKEFLEELNKRFGW